MRKKFLPIMLLAVVFAGSVFQASARYDEVIPPDEGETKDKACQLTASSPSEGSMSCLGRGSLCSAVADCRRYTD